MACSHPAPRPDGSAPRGDGGGLGPSLRRAWVGYQRRLDQALAEAGFDDRRFPDGRVLRICRRTPGTTIAGIGRELGVSRQAAAAIVAGLRRQGYVEVSASATSGREKAVALTDRGRAYLDAHRRAARALDAELRRAVGAEGWEQLARLVDVLANDQDDLRLRGYLRDKASPGRPPTRG